MFSSFHIVSKFDVYTVSIFHFYFAFQFYFLLPSFLLLGEAFLAVTLGTVLLSSSLTQAAKSGAPFGAAMVSVFFPPMAVVFDVFFCIEFLFGWFLAGFKGLLVAEFHCFG